ncbi:MAG: hypothetical protein IKI20_02040 [Lachnospiraceae bacterium]|nr:hypothetical protein [Lachnospiraceae bacterium]
MNPEQRKAKYGVGGAIAIMMQIQLIVVCAALILTSYGIISTLKTGKEAAVSIEWNRLIVYTLQAITCIAILVFGTLHFHKKKIAYFKWVVYCYAFLEAVRCALLSTNGIEKWPSIVAKFLLVMLACGLILLAEHLGEKKYNILAYVLIFLEAALFLVFAFNFATNSRLLFKLLPIIGVLICASICLFNEAKIKQKAYFDGLRAEKAKEGIAE